MTLFDQIQSTKIETISLGEIPIGTILPPGDSPPPSRELIEAVRLYGQIIEPLVLIKLPKPMMVVGQIRFWRIVSGRRRYLAAAEVGLARLPGIELRAVDGADDALTIGLNRFRSDNLVADLRAAAALFAAGLEDREVRKLTGLTAPEIKRLRGIAASDPRIIQALADGRCAPSVAEAAAKLPPQRQKALMDAFAERLSDPKAKLTAKDVDAVKDAIQANAVAALPASLFEITAPAAWPRPGIELTETVGRLLEEFGEEAVLNTIEDLKTKERKAA